MNEAEMEKPNAINATVSCASIVLFSLVTPARKTKTKASVDAIPSGRFLGFATQAKTSATMETIPTTRPKAG